MLTLMPPQMERRRCPKNGHISVFSIWWGTADMPWSQPCSNGGRLCYCTSNPVSLEIVYNRPTKRQSMLPFSPLMTLVRILTTSVQFTVFVILLAANFNVVLNPGEDPRIDMDRDEMMEVSERGRRRSSICRC